jgi:hypothetical protein
VIEARVMGGWCCAMGGWAGEHVGKTFRFASSSELAISFRFVSLRFVSFRFVRLVCFVLRGIGFASHVGLVLPVGLLWGWWVVLGAGLEGFDGRCFGFSEWNGVVSLFFFASRAEAWALELS